MEIWKYIKDIRITPSNIKNMIPKLECLTWYFADPKGYWYLNLLFENANIPCKYRYMFLTDKEWEVFIDCWMNVWWVTDIARYMDMEVYWFEPNPSALKYILNKKYEKDDKVHIYPCAVSNEEWEIDFYLDPQWLFDQWATIIKEQAEIEGGGRLNNSIKVPVRKLTDIIKKDILPKHKHIHMLKIDIEGSEFWVVNDLIDEWLYKDVTYIVVETHERFFKNGQEMLKNLKDKINNNNIKNIYLDWI